MNFKGIVRIGFLGIFLISAVCYHASGQKADSLEALLSHRTGTMKLKILLELSQLLSDSDPRRGLSFARDAYELAVKLHDEPARAQALENTGWCNFYSGDFLKAATYLTRSLAIYQDAGDKTKIGNNLQNIGLCYLQASVFDKAQEYLLQAAVQFAKDNDKKKLAYCDINLGLVKYMKGDYAGALEFYEKASLIYKEIDEREKLSELKNRIAMTYWSLGMNDKALRYMMESNDLRKPADLKELGTGYNNIGAIYKDLSEISKALEYYRKALSVYKKAGDSLSLPLVLSNIGTIYSTREQYDTALQYYESSIKISVMKNLQLQTAKTRHNMALIYLKTDQEAKAKEYFTNFMNLSREIGYREGVAHALLGLGDLARREGKPRHAADFYRKSIALADSMHFLKILFNGHQCMAELLEAEHKYKEALEYFQKAVQVKDTLLSSEKNKVISDLNVKYETEKKVRENDLLKIDNELKNKQIKSLYLIIGAALLIISLLVLLVIQVRKSALHRKKLVASENTRLMEKIDHQNRELTSSALSLSRNFNFIHKLVNDLKELSSYVSEQGFINLLNIIHNIQHLESNPAWDQFELCFERVHTQFYDNLRMEFPTLTPNEARLCAFLKLGMSTKEISSITFQNIRAIEAARLRLRKKLKLEASQDLNLVLQKF